MNGRKSKLARRLAKDLAFGWLKTLVSEEEAKKTSVQLGRMLQKSAKKGTK